MSINEVILRVILKKASDLMTRHMPPDGLTDQQTLAEMHVIFNGHTASADKETIADELVREAVEVLRRFDANDLTEHEAVNELFSILDGPACLTLLEQAPDTGDVEEEICKAGI